VKRSELYSIRSILQTALKKVGLLHEDTEPYRILGGLISELDVAYDGNKSLSVAVEEGDEEGGEGVVVGREGEGGEK
jgi:hypothetical protein